jgi:hypothetical protein
MDTGYSDHDPFNVKDVRVALTPQEETWHLDKITGFGGSTILLSHHQLFSSYAAIGPADPDGRRLPHNPNLLRSLQTFQAARPVAAWFWGHEHSMTLYKPYLGLSAGRCLGHGAIPVTAADSPYAGRPDLTEIPPALDDPRMLLAGGLYAHGYAMLTLGGEGGIIRADYYSMAQPNAPIFSEKIAPNAAMV